MLLCILFQDDAVCLNYCIIINLLLRIFAIRFQENNSCKNNLALARTWWHKVFFINETFTLALKLNSCSDVSHVLSSKIFK